MAENQTAGERLWKVSHDDVVMYFHDEGSAKHNYDAFARAGMHPKLDVYRLESQIRDNDLPPDDDDRTPLAWKYRLGDGVWRYQRKWSNGANMYPVFEITAEIELELEKQDAK